MAYLVLVCMCIIVCSYNTYVFWCVVFIAVLFCCLIDVIRAECGNNFFLIFCIVTWNFMFFGLTLFIFYVRHSKFYMVK